jgi:protocatechuate 3,4-dioxygenase beta subunit
MAAKKEKYGSIYGSITEAGKNTFVADLTVQCLQKNTVIATAVSDQNGFYRFDKLKPGTYTIKINDPNFAVYENKKVKIKANKPALLNIVLVANPQKPVPEKKTEKGKLSITVTDNNTPLQYASVAIYDNNKRLTVVRQMPKGKQLF